MNYQTLSLVLLCSIIPSIYGMDCNNNDPSMREDDSGNVENMSWSSEESDEDDENRGNVRFIGFSKKLIDPLLEDLQTSQKLQLGSLTLSPQSIYKITIATEVRYRFGLQNKSLRSDDIVHPLHRPEYFNERKYDNYYYPYKFSDGGLSNTALSYYGHTIDENPSNNNDINKPFKEVVMAIGCIVRASDIYNPHGSYDWTPEEKDIFAKHGDYAPAKLSLLERAVLGFLREQAIDIRDNETGYVNRYVECIKREWTSKKKLDDDGMRTLEDRELLKKHIYFDEHGYTEGTRSGERLRILLDGNNDPHASVELTKFSVTVKKMDE